MPHVQGSSYRSIKCRLEPPGLPPCIIVRLSDEQGSIWLPALQTYQLCRSFLRCNTSLAAFERLCATRGGSKLLTGPDRQQVVLGGAAQSRASRVSILKLHVLLKKLGPRLSIPGKLLLDQMTQLGSLATLTPWQELQDVWQVPMPLPARFPESSGVSPQSHVIMALSKVAPALLQCSPLSEQLAEFRTWLTNDIQLDRDGHALARRSYINIESVVHRFLGFLHLHCSLQRPSLTDLLQPEAHSKFYRYLIEKKASHYAPRTHAYVICKVISWLQAQPQGSHDSLQQLKAWLRRGAAQIKASLPVRRRDIAIMRASGTWADAADVLAAILKGKRLAEQLACEPPVQHAAAQDIHDATLACCIFGFLPPPRLTCLRECILPDYTGPCLHPDCKDSAACRGNRLVDLTGGSSRLGFSFPHHKTSNSRQRHRAIQFTLPQELSDLVRLYLKVGRPMLVNRSPSSTPHPYLFVSRRGHSLASKSGAAMLTSMFQGWLGRHGCKQIAPSLCRHIFVVDRRSHAHLPGPVDDDAAIAMGHSCKQWDAGIYDVSKHATAAQKAVDSMAEWRQSHHPAGEMQQPAANDQSNAANDDAAEDLYLSFSDDDME